MSTLVVLQPAGSQGSREHYADTVANLVDIEACEPYLAPQVFRRLKEIHPSGFAAMWGVVPGTNEVNRKKWERMSEGNLVLFSSDNKIHTSAIVSAKFTSRKLAEKLWGLDKDSETWQYMYTLDEVKSLDIPYEEFNSVVGYKVNNIIQGFTVMDAEKSSRFLDYFNLWSDKHFDEVTDEEFDEVLNNLDGDLDRQASGWHRKEQAKGRKRLLRGRTVGICMICGNQMSAEFLIAAHIKRRSECTDEEKRDLDGVMMLACKFGCDYLYEAGFLSIEGSKIKVSDNLTDLIGVKYASPLKGREVKANEKQLKYFEWHFKNKFQKSINK
jgi:hypothetical protein